MVAEAEMNGMDAKPAKGARWQWALWSLLGATLCWLSQPPLGLGWLAWVALVPWIHLTGSAQWSRDKLAVFYFIACGYWALTMQGIRHAHPAMYATWMLFAFYLASYSLLFVWLVRHLNQQFGQRLPRWVAIPIVGTGLECVRNYFLTGISAVMLGHTQVDHSMLVQIADLFGSYGLSFVVLLVNAVINEWMFGEASRSRWIATATACAVLIVTLGYGSWRLNQSENLKKSSTTIALIGQDEESIFVQDMQREQRIFGSYVNQSLKAAADAGNKKQAIDAVVWPESMYNGGLPWMIRDAKAPPPATSSDPELATMILDYREQFQQRSQQIQQAIRATANQASIPQLIVGCSVVQYEEPPAGYSGVVHVNSEGVVDRWYGKTHLVMFGEYIPLIDYLPFIKALVPPGMGVTPGTGPETFKVNDCLIAPTVCIETAVERVIPQQLARLHRQAQMPDVVVNVTNDRWFDHSSVVEHHLRCARFVAIACRRPVLIAANGGPTAWIDSSGRIVERLSNDTNGFLLVNPQLDDRISPYLRIQDWPARLLGLFVLVLGFAVWWRRRRDRKSLPVDT